MDIVVDLLVIVEIHGDSDRSFRLIGQLRFLAKFGENQGVTDGDARRIVELETAADYTPDAHARDLLATIMQQGLGPAATLGQHPVPGIHPIQASNGVAAVKPGRLGFLPGDRRSPIGNFGVTQSGCWQWVAVSCVT